MQSRRRIPLSANISNDVAADKQQARKQAKQNESNDNKKVVQCIVPLL